MGFTLLPRFFLDITQDDEPVHKKKRRRDSNQNFKVSEKIEGVPANLIGITTDETDESRILFLVENTEGVSSLITRKTAHKEIPHLLIKFYENRLQWILEESQEKTAKKEK
jgi:hypothetical protein